MEFAGPLVGLLGSFAAEVRYTVCPKRYAERLRTRMDELNRSKDSTHQAARVKITEQPWSEINPHVKDWIVSVEALSGRVGELNLEGDLPFWRRLCCCHTYEFGDKIQQYLEEIDRLGNERPDANKGDLVIDVIPIADLKEKLENDMGKLKATARDLDNTLSLLETSVAFPPRVRSERVKLWIRGFHSLETEEKDKGKVPSELDIMDQVYCNQPIMTEIHDYIDVHANEEMENCGNFASEAYNDIIKPRKTNRLRCIGGGSNLSTQSCNTAKGVKSKFVDASQTKNEERITNLEGEIHDIKDLIKKLTDNQEKYLNLFPPHIANCYTYPPPPHPYHSYMHLVSQHGSTGASGASINEQAYMYSQRADERNLRADERNLRADERNLRADGRNMNEDGYQSHAAGNRR